MAAFAQHSTAPTLADIEAIAAEVYAAIPGELVAQVTGVAIRVVDFPDEATIEAMELESEFDILGLYAGTSLDQKSFGDVAPDVDMIYLYRRPLLEYWIETGEDLVHLVRHVLIHEIGHHFGFSDADMERIEAGAGA